MKLEVRNLERKGDGQHAKSFVGMSPMSAKLGNGTAQTVCLFER
jgi:hypothetical protein